MISRRENFLLALQCKRSERMPVVFVIDNFNYPNDLPAELFEPFDWVRIQRHLGADIIDRIGPSVVTGQNSRVKFTATDRPDGTQFQEWETAAGKLSGVYRHSQEAGANFVEQYFIRETAGYDIVAAICEGNVLAVDESAVRATQARIDEIGGEGVLYSTAPASPVMDLMRTWVGMEQLIYDMADYADVVERTMDAMARKAYEYYELLAANTPAKLIVFWEDVTSLHLSPDTFRRYALPFYRTISDICHSHGKLLVMHTCGRFRAFYDLMLESGIDAIDWVTPPETGDVVFAEAQEAFAGRICVMGTVLPSVMRFEGPDAVEAHVRHILNGVDLTNGFVFMVPAPVGSPMANIDRVKQVVAAP
jgi:hypothetical protein